MAGIMEKLKGAFGGKKQEPYAEPATRVGRAEPVVEEDDKGQMWKTAKKWREQKAMEDSMNTREKYKGRF